MNLIPYDVDKLNITGCFRPSKNLVAIEEFVRSEMDCAEVRDFMHKSSKSAASAFRQTMHRFKIRNVRVVESKGRVFLIKENIK